MKYILLLFVAAVGFGADNHCYVYKVEMPCTKSNPHGDILCWMRCDENPDWKNFQTDCPAHEWEDCRSGGVVNLSVSTKKGLGKWDPPITYEQWEALEKRVESIEKKLSGRAIYFDSATPEYSNPRGPVNLPGASTLESPKVNPLPFGTEPE